MYMFMYMYIDTHAGPLNFLRGRVSSISTEMDL